MNTDETDTGKRTRSRKQERPDPEFVEALARGLDVIHAFTAEKPEMTLSEVAERTGISPATARRSLITLRQLGYVGMNGKHYLLRAKVLSLGSAFLNSMNLKDVADSFLQDVNDQFHDAVSLAIMDGRHVLYVSHISNRRDVRYRARIGFRLPIYCTSLGHVLLAYASPETRAAYMEHASLQSYTARTISTKEELERALEAVRENGYAGVQEQLEYSVVSVAVPVRARDGEVLAAINCSGELERASLETMIETRVPELHKAAERIGAALERHPALVHSIRSGRNDPQFR